MAMNIKAADITREQMLELLADLSLTDIPPRSTIEFREWESTMLAARAVLSIGGGVAGYVRFKDPRQLYIPTRRNEYAIGWVRSNPKKGRLIVSYDHLADISTRDEDETRHQDDESTHVLGAYFGKPFTEDEIRDAFYACMERTDDGQKQVPAKWVTSVYGEPPAQAVYDNLDARLFSEHLDWFYGPGHRFARTVKCRHEYGLFDSCPGCDHDEEMGLGPWAGMKEDA